MQVRNSRATSTFELINSSLTYRKSQWEFNLEGTNLLNVDGIRRDSFSESLTSMFEYFIRKRYRLFSVTYDI